MPGHELMKKNNELSLPLSSSDFGSEAFADLDFFSRFRRHPGFSVDDLFSICSHDAMSVMLKARCGVVCIDGNDRISLILAITDLPWESDFFGIPMGRLYLFKAPSFPLDRLSVLVSDLVQTSVRDHGIVHVSIDVDIDDYSVLNCLIKHDFEILDLKRTYFTNFLEVESIYKKGLSSVRGYVPDDFSAVDEILKEVSFETRFTRDRYLDRCVADQMYREWFYRSLEKSGKTANVAVYERLGRVVACGGIGELDFSRYGLAKKLRTGSIYACSRRGVGGYGPVLYQLTSDALRTHGLVETTVSLNNSAAVRVVEGVRPNRSVTTYCLRKFSGQ